MSAVKDRPSIDFIGIGAARAGTTWLADMLRMHDDVFIPNKKELHYFNNNQLYTPDLDGFYSYFEGASESQKRGEITPRYIINEEALKRIHHHFADVKIIIILRDPVERAYSQYNYFKVNKRKEFCPDFEQALEGCFHEDYVEKSLYAACVKRVFNIFAPEQVKIVLFDDIKTRPEETLNEVCDFIGVDALQKQDAFEKKINSSKAAIAETPFTDSLYHGFHPKHAKADSITHRIARKILGAVGPLFRSIEGGIKQSTDAKPSRLSDDVKARVFEAYFAEDVKELQSLIDHDVSSWVPKL